MSKIIPGKGTEDLTFGTPKKEVLKLLGEPTEIENVVEDDDELPIEIWHYDELELSLSFENIGEEVLFAMAVSAEKWTLDKLVSIGMEESNISDTLEKLNLGEYDTEDMSDDEDQNQHLYFYPDSNLSLWFDNGTLSEIQWGPFWNEDKEDFIWPN